MRVIEVCGPSFRHPVYRRLEDYFVQDETVAPYGLDIEVCETRRGEPMCSCVRFALEWIDAAPR